MEYVTLNNGVKMPVLGFGVYQLEDGKSCEMAVSSALESGYRMIDTAQAYFNEESVGRAVEASGLKREDLFLVTKIWISNCGEARAWDSLRESLDKLRTSYVDLLLIHQPFGDYYGTYRAMEHAYEEGLVRAIGVSNFYPDRFVDLCHFVKITPMVNQLENHVFFQQRQAREFLEAQHCQLMSWGPFAEGRNDFFSNERLSRIAKAHGKTVAQVALRFLIQEGAVVIPKSVKPERMIENMAVFDFELSSEELGVLRQLDGGKSLFLSHSDPHTVEWLVNWLGK